MTYGTLAFQRYKYTGVKLADDEDRYVDREAAAEHYAKTVTRPAEQSYQRELAEQRRARSEFADSAVIHEPPTTRRQRRALVGAEQLTLDGRVHTVPAGAAERFIQQEAEKRYPDPPKPDVRPFEAWFQQNSEQRRVWGAWFITAEATEPVIPEIALFGDQGFPVSEAMGELDRWKQAGWRLVQVSEDHGLYKGADAADEAYLTRVRYLLAKD